MLCAAGVKFWSTLIKTSQVKGPTPLPSGLFFEYLYREMGLSHSKPHPRVTKVAPLQNKEEELPSASPVDFAFSQNLEEKSSYLFTGLQDQNKALEGQLPPLRETWYGRYSAGKRKTHHEICVFGPRRAIGRCAWLSVSITISESF